MVDLDFFQDRADKRSTPRPGGSDFLNRSERAKDSNKQGWKNA
jgi:hypothetical protein